MCGIVGRLNGKRDKLVQPDELRAATRLVAHRGPDGEGIFCRGNVGLGHRRLSIVDIDGGAQPMTNAARSVWVVFNGEIYNHAALRAELTSKGYEFRTYADTEVLVHGYSEWGEKLVNRLRGMFAFALWDAADEKLVVARDRVGIKPLYFAHHGGDLLFASEVKSLFAFHDLPRALDSSQFGAYLALRYVPGPSTMFRGIQRLSPGHLLVMERGKLRIDRYWDIPVEASAARRAFDEREEADRLGELLRETTRGHLMGEVPVGLFLSGGIDSTAIAWAMRAAGVQHLKTFSVGFDDDSEGELVYARLAAQAFGTTHRELKVGAFDFRDAMPELVWHLDEPNADGACIPLMLLARRAREEVTVILSGEGADELYGGYGIYRKLLGLERARRLGGAALLGAAASGLRVVKSTRLRKYLAMLGREPRSHYFGVGRGFTDELLAEVMGPQVLDRLVAHFAPLWARTEGAPALHRLLYNDTRVWLPDDLLIKADKMTMSAALELRVPFLDHVVLENAWRVPPSLKIRGGVGKWLLRRALEDRIPSGIVRRPKKGFPVPIGRWLRTSLYGACRDRLLAANGASRGMLGANAITRLLEEHRSGLVDRTEELYSLWVFEEWHRAWMSPQVVHPVRNVIRTSATGPWDPPSTNARPVRATGPGLEP